MSIDTIRCKCCLDSSPFIGNLDFNKSCLDHGGQKPFLVAGLAVPYHCCPNCGFVFTAMMDQWSAEEFRTRIYNADYIKADPPIPGRDNVPAEETPAYHKGKYVASFFQGAQSEIRVLDFGSGGNPGPTGLALLEEGFNLQSYDPFRADASPLGDDDRFDLILAIEVFEHVVDLEDLGYFMRRRLSRGGLIWIETVLHPFPSPSNVLESWYIAPRNGHISIFSLHALTALFRAFDINIVQTSVGLFGFAELPRFPNRIFLHA